MKREVSPRNKRHSERPPSDYKKCLEMPQRSALSRITDTAHFKDKVWVEGSGNYPAHRLGQLGLNLQITHTESLQLLKVLFSDKSKFSIHADLLNGVRNSNQCPDFRFHQNMKSKTKQLPTERIFFPGEDF